LARICGAELAPAHSRESWNPVRCISLGPRFRGDGRLAQSGFFASIKLTCAATTCQPSGKRAQVCI
jgi:hypothetical protein